MPSRDSSQHSQEHMWLIFLIQPHVCFELFDTHIFRAEYRKLFSVSLHISLHYSTDSTEQIRMVTFFCTNHSSTHYKTCHHDVMGHLNLHKAKQSLRIIYLSNSPELLYISPFKFSNYEQRQIYLLRDLNNIANI